MMRWRRQVGQVTLSLSGQSMVFGVYSYHSENYWMILSRGEVQADLYFLNITLAALSGRTERDEKSSRKTSKETKIEI